MNNFNYWTPTKVIFGKNAEKQTGKLVKAQNCKKSAGALRRRQCKAFGAFGQNMRFFKNRKHRLCTSGRRCA